MDNPQIPDRNDLVDLLKHQSAVIDRTRAIPMFRPAGSLDADALADSTSKHIVHLEDGQKGFLIVSGHGNPDLVARGVRNINATRQQVSARTAAPVIAPIDEGVVMGMSYAIWPMLIPVPSGKLRSYLIRRKLDPVVLNWLHALCAETKTELVDLERDGLSACLELLAQDHKHSSLIRKAAETAARRLADRAWTPVHCVQHSDLWMGNVMLAPKEIEADFAVIDWAGANLSGFPFIDLCRFAISSRIPSSLVLDAVRRELNALDCAPEDVMSYVLGALGQIQSNLEFFPEDLFRGMFAETTGFAARVIDDL